jgi:hypothetical protein
MKARKSGQDKVTEGLHVGNASKIRLLSRRGNCDFKALFGVVLLAVAWGQIVPIPSSAAIAGRDFGCRFQLEYVLLIYPKIRREHCDVVSISSINYVTKASLTCSISGTRMQV